MNRPYAVAAVALALLVGGACSPDSSHLNVVVISIDTLGARHLGCYGYTRDTSPTIDRFAADSILFENAYSTAPKTPESHMSMFTSLYPSVHQVLAIMEADRIHVLDESITTLTELLKNDGYTTAGFHGGGFVDPKFGFSRGFDLYENREQDHAEQWLRENAAKGKFFLFFHTYRVHDPYLPKPPFDTLFTQNYDGGIIHDAELLGEAGESGDWVAQAGEFWQHVDKSDPDDVARLVALYDGSIAQMDQWLESLLSTIEQHAPRTLVILLSDHGEEFGQHGGFTHNQLYNELLHIPLILRHPDLPRGLRIPERVSLLDLAPTILELLSIPAIDQFQGKSLVPLIEGGGDTRAVFSEYPGGRLTSVIDEDRKLIATKDGHEFYHLTTDPGEQQDLGEAPTDDHLVGLLEAFAAANATEAAALNTTEVNTDLSEETLEKLKTLGYID